MTGRAVLAVFAHPDDESLAAGGTLARYAREGATVRVLTFTDGVSSRGVGALAPARRRDEYLNACAALGATPLPLAPFSDQQLDITASLHLARVIEAALDELRPDVVVTHWPHDLNADHRAVAQAVLVATRPVAGSRVRRVLAAEVPESTSQAFGAPAFAPTVFVALTVADQERKTAALACYASERREWPHPRSSLAAVQRLSMWGGVAGVPFAEAFALLREVQCL